MTCANREDLDRPPKLHSLIGAFSIVRHISQYPSSMVLGKQTTDFNQKLQTDLDLCCRQDTFFVWRNT